MRRQINNLVSVVYSFFRILLLKLLHGSSADISFVERISPDVVLEINRGGKIKLADRVRIHSGSKVKVRRGGSLSIGRNARINYNCMFFCHNSITIGEGCEFGPGVLVYDHDHDFRYPDGLDARKYKVTPVIIGNNCWIGANTVILRGTTIGDNCVIGAGCVIKGSIPALSVVVQKRENQVTDITIPQ